MAALVALGRIRYHVNTTGIIENCLTDSNVFIRLSGAGELISIHRNYGDVLGSNVVDTLLECINRSTDTEVLWIAAFRLGCLGEEAKRAIPYLEKLARHENEYVRRRAKEALQKMKGIR